MTAYVQYGNGVSFNQAGHTDPQGGPGIVYFTSDFDASKQNLTTSDTAQLATLPLGAYIEDVFVNILTADAGGGGLNVGDGSQAAGYGAYATLSAAGPLAVAAGSATTYLYTVTTNAKLKPKLIAAANDQKLLIAPTTASVTTLRVRVTVKAFTPA